LCDRLAALIADPRDPSRVVHLLSDILRARASWRSPAATRAPKPRSAAPRSRRQDPMGRWIAAACSAECSRSPAFGRRRCLHLHKVLLRPP
jgi:hypothetical protein